MMKGINRQSVQAERSVVTGWLQRAWQWGNGVAATLLFGILVGCSVNPVTDQRELNFMSEEWERGVGKQMYAPMRQSQGGDYTIEPELVSYVQTVGQRVANMAERDLAYEFAVINDSTPNAWALPGGKISIHRGLLTELESEAQLAAVIGHEIVHADAAHGARAQSRGVLTQVGAVGAAVLLGTQVDSAPVQQVGMLGVQLGAQLITQKYGRDAEREADAYGLQYLSRAGYDPQAAVELQETFVRIAEERGDQSGFMSGLFRSHPPSRERVQNNKATATTLPPGGERGADMFKQKTAHLKRIEPAYEAHDEGRAALADGRFDEAARLAAKAREIEPREALFYALSGDVHAEQEQYKAARDDYSAALQRNSGFFYYHLRRGQVHYELGNYSAGRADLNRSLELLPTAQAHFLLGQIDQRSNRNDSAIAHYRQAAESSSPSREAARRELARLDLGRNPSQYIATQVGRAQDGSVGVAVQNRAGVPVENVRLNVAVLDERNQVRQSTRTVNQVLSPEETVIVPLGIRGMTDAQLAQRVRVTVAQASPASR